jgi:uracil-DNA glycosylase
MNYLHQALTRLQPDWRDILTAPQTAPTLEHIDQRLAELEQNGEVLYPPKEMIFSALSHFAPAQTRVVILGQDPYHGAGEAMGLSFSVPPGIRIPPSLRNIFKEQESDLGIARPLHGDLTTWARQGVLLLNSVMTVTADKAGSHGKLGWQTISDRLIDAVVKESPACVFMLWGNWARGKTERIDRQRHLVLEAAHPSPLSASRGFLGCRHFSQANRWMQQRGYPAIDWSLGGQEGLF